MKFRLKKLSEQVVVITGATSGIGLTTARRAAQRGAKLVLVARNEDALKQLNYELSKKGCDVLHVVADVGIEEDVKRVANAAVERFGSIDTWVNNAGISIFGRNEDISLEDQRKLFQTNFWGVVYGSLAAVEHMKERGGAIINLGSEVSDRAVPLQGMYSASKHAVKGFTDSLRLELEADNAPISVTLIKPAAIDTMFVEHAKNYMNVEPKLPPPIYAPEIAADAILYAAENPKRDIFVGGAAKFVSATAHYAPGLMDSVMKRFMFKQQQTSMPARDKSQNSLYNPGSDLQQRQGHPGHVFESSLYTKASYHPKTVATLLTAGLVLAAWWRLRDASRTRADEHQAYLPEDGRQELHQDTPYAAYAPAASH
ncbi:SDR family oxidoreductase [Noviherbaspirillum sp. CPCC 100848]|uniref:SDR family oxidoreductase n=1 Tax=Noviherbaspirillum album TaxID=3080276 RepID=A0ABU6JKI5_9BURK|nr:SDR family oxidoreductase [Noviherbaspirillum sp. CPCC 100848]MEC4723674.1 SDR family oxidoreductase [Noviherbaspirillum sp. CPCC 100848]